jgi:3-oxoacyl-[acyl-carrier-protein] synthase II
LDTDRLSKVSVFSAKGHIGHTFCAAGGIETILGIKAMQDGICPNTLNLNDPLDEGEGFNFVMNKPQKQDIQYMLKTSLAFGGHNNVLILKKFNYTASI